MIYNANLYASEFEEESENFKPVHPEAHMDLLIRNNDVKQRNLLSDFGPYSRALTARRDVAIRCAATLRNLQCNL